MAAGRVVTLLFTDLVGSTELFQRLGEEQAESFRRAHFGLLRAAVETHGGQEVKTLGDGIMATFPTEPDALRAAVAMQQAVDSQSPVGGGPAAAIRVGLHTGETLEVDGDHFGTAVIVAKRLCDIAAPAQILAGQATVERTGAGVGTSWRPLGGLRLKGLAEPVAAVEVLWRPSSSTVSPSPPPGSGPHGHVVRPPALTPPADALVGRDTDLGKLAGMLLGARLVTVTGPGGVGKTRLCGHLVDLVAPRYPDGIWCCPLASLTADGQVSAAVATTLLLVSARPHQGTTRYALLEPIRAYAEHRLRQRGEYSDARAAHARWCLAVTEDARKGLRQADARRWVARLEQELNNLRAAQNWFLETGDADGALGPAQSWIFHGLSSGISELYAWARTAAEAFATTAHPALPHAWATAAVGSWLGGDLGGASLLAHKAAAAAGDDAVARSHALHMLGVTSVIAGNFAQACDYLVESAELSEQAGDLLLATYSLGTHALARAYEGAWRPAEVLADRALALAEASQSPAALAWALYCAGEARLDTAPQEARVYLERSLEIAQGSNRFVSGVAGLSLVSLDVRHGDPLEALGRYPTLIEHFQRSAAWIQLWITIRNLIQALPRPEASEAAAVLYGALSASETAPPVAGEDRQRLTSVVQRLRADLGEDAFAERCSRGAALGDAGAIAFAVETLRGLRR